MFGFLFTGWLSRQRVCSGQLQRLTTLVLDLTVFALTLVLLNKLTRRSEKWGESAKEHHLFIILTSYTHLQTYKISLKKIIIFNELTISVY